METYWGWALMMPALLSLLYGWTSYQIMDRMGYHLTERLLCILSTALLSVLWLIVHFPLPLFYFLCFTGQLLRLLKRSKERSNELLLILITSLDTMAIHMTAIGALSIIRQVPMDALLHEGLWRSLSISAVLLLHSLPFYLLQKHATALVVLRSQDGGEESKPFLLFLWLCLTFLVMDSILCVSHFDWPVLPVLLISSTALILVFAQYFLFHIYRILKVRYLEEEHEKLQEELERHSQTADILKEQSHTDPMTKIHSRRYLMDCIARYLEDERPFSLAYLDLDGLKQVNDRYGHRAGDEYLIHFTEMFKKKLRATDTFARIGGDEFATLFPDCTSDLAQKRIEEIRAQLAQEYVMDHSLSFSYGVAYASGDGELTVEQIIHQADQAMYQDKGRSRE